MQTMDRTSETHELREEIIPVCMREIIAEAAAGENGYGDAPEEITPGHTIRTRFVEEPTGDRVTVMQAEVAPGVGEAPSTPADEEQVFHVLRGTFWVKVGEEIRTARAGDTVFLPRGVAQGWRQVSNEGGAYVKVVAPAGTMRETGVPKMYAARGQFAVAAAHHG
jgi:quercetin dioxygenase-like cupin family protein